MKSPGITKDIMFPLEGHGVVYQCYVVLRLFTKKNKAEPPGATRGEESQITKVIRIHLLWTMDKCA